MEKPALQQTDAHGLALYECGELRFTGTDNYDRHVVFDHAVSMENASDRERFEAVARALRDLLTQRWLLTEQTYEHVNAKRIYYLSMEFLIGRTLIHNIINLGVEQFVRDDLCSDPRQNWTDVIDAEPDAGLGNGGLGRLAACFMDSLASLAIPLIVDELGYVPLSPTGAELLFEVFSQRYERGSIIVTSNLPFDEWTGVFGSERLTGALLDRLTHHVHILELNGDSFRLKHSKRRIRDEKPPTEPG